MELSSQNIVNVIRDCFCDNITDEEKESIISGNYDKTKFIVVRSIGPTYVFLKSKLESHREDIESMLMELPDAFMESGGGGYSLIYACVDHNDKQWGEQKTSDDLLTLGIGLGIVEHCLPRSMWSTLPGGVPYYVIKDKKFKTPFNRKIKKMKKKETVA